MVFAGIDAGSRAIKIVLLRSGRGATAPAGAGDRNGAPSVLCFAEHDQGPQPGAATEEFYHRVLAENGLDRGRVRRAVATGYARAAVASADATITEITCHAAGVRHLLPQARTVVEIGGQDSKLLRLAEDGGVRDFDMNDRCAAGTGRFLELVADRLGCGLAGLGDLAGRAGQPAAISSMCAVFAETEIIGLLAGGRSPGDIVAGVQAAVASRIAAMAGGRVVPPLAFTGGVARLPGMREAIGAALRHEALVPDRPQFTGALGAALLAMREDGR